MRAALYARVSSRAQADRHTIESQLRALRTFVAARGWQPSGEYIDDGRTARSGHLDARAGFARLVADAAAGRFDVAVVFDLDRLTRSEDLAERGQILGAFQRAGVKLAIATSGQVLDLASSMGDLFSGLQAFFAAEENRKRSERTIAGKLRAVAEGRPPGAAPPFGITYSRSAGWGIDEDEAEVVRELFRRVASGESARSLDLELIERGTARSRGGRWGRGAVYRIVTSSAYRGEWIVSKARSLRVAVPRLVDDATWYAAQDALRYTGRAHLRRTRSVYLLEGLARCELCDARVSVCSHGFVRPGVPLRPPTYVCRRRARPAPGQPPCPAPHRRTSDVDAAVWEELVRVLSRPDLVAEAIARRSARARADGETWESDLADAKKRLARLERAEAVILDRFRRGLVSEGAMDAELAAAARERALLERQVATAHRAAGGAVRAQAGAGELEAAIARVRGRVRLASHEERQALVRALLGGRPVIVGPKEIRAMFSLSIARADVRQAMSASWTTAHHTDRASVMEFPVVVRRAG